MPRLFCGVGIMKLLQDGLAGAGRRSYLALFGMIIANYFMSFFQKFVVSWIQKDYTGQVRHAMGPNNLMRIRSTERGTITFGEFGTEVITLNHLKIMSADS